MPDAGAAKSAFRFGVFELNLRTGELRKQGVRIRLQEQPLRVLILLLEHPGNLVTREQIQQKLWPLGTHVDFDNAINSAVRKLREALGDTSENPRFIETLPRRGYRFLVNVQGPPQEEQSSLVATALPPETRGPVSNLWARKRGIRFGLLALSAVCLVTAILYLSLGRVTQPSVFSSTPFTSYTGLETCPSFAPDGERVAFAWNGQRGDNFDIYVKQIADGRLLRLTFGAEIDISPSWSPDGHTIAFLHVIDATKAEVSLMSALAREHVGP